VTLLGTKTYKVKLLRTRIQKKTQSYEILVCSCGVTVLRAVRGGALG